MLSPRHKRVYLDESANMAANELEFTGQSLSNPITDIRQEDIGGVPYILFSREEALTEDEVGLISRLSFTHAIFCVHSKSGDILLAPIPKNCDYFIDEDISAILKYSGKTNELFTRLMINLAQAHTKTNPRIRLLDPMAGKGTTLFEGLMQNMDVYGIEIDPKPAHEAFTYIKKHFEMARYKHTSHTEKVGGQAPDGKKIAATRYQVEMAPTKQAQKEGGTRQFEIIAGDTRHATAFYKKGFFNILVADLPYGVQHSAKKKPQPAGFTRNALELVKEAMPGWVKLLKPGGVVVLAWNLFLIKREEMAAVFAEYGLTVQEGLDFSHRLDQATHRDLMVGVVK